MAESAPGVVVGRAWGNANARKHGASGQDVSVAALGRLQAVPDYLRLPVFAEAVNLAQRRLEMADRVGRWVSAMGEAALVPSKAGSSAPAEISRQHDTAAMNALSALGLTPASAARFGRLLEERQRPDLALLAEAMLERLDGDDDAG